MKKFVFAVALLLTLSLTGCTESLDDLNRDAHFTKVCHEAGGRTTYDGSGDLVCDFRDR